MLVTVDASAAGLSFKITVNGVAVGAFDDKDPAHAQGAAGANVALRGFHGTNDTKDPWRWLLILDVIVAVDPCS